jgi:sulfate-transporting ATPase
VFAPGPVPLSSAAVLAMRDFELEDVADRLPAEISFGQRKAVAIARAVAARPAILLLDEPAAGLDGESVAELERLIRTVSREWGIGVLLVEHKVDLVMSVCDRITVLVGGKFLTSGSPEEVRRDNRVRDAYLGHRGEASPEGDELADADAAAAAISGS